MSTPGGSFLISKQINRRARVCCCGHAWIDHDTAHCTGKGCGCRGFHESNSPALHRALHDTVTR